MVFLFVGSSALSGGFLPTGVSGKSVDEFVRLALSLVYPSECCIVSHTTELLDSTQKAHFSQFRQPVCHTPDVVRADNSRLKCAGSSGEMRGRTDSVGYGLRRHSE